MLFCFFTLASSSSSILERSRSSGRLVPAVPLPTSEAGQLKRTSAASTSALSRSSAGALPSPTTPCTTQPPSSTPAAAATTAAASAGSTSSILSTQNQDQNGCSSVGNNRTENHPSEQNTIGYVIYLTDTYVLWQYGLWSFQAGGTKLERFLQENY